MVPTEDGGSDEFRHELGPAVEALTRVARVLERASGGLSLSHYRVLRMVAAGDGRASRLAERLALGKPAISAAVESLANRGLLVRSNAVPDRRTIHLEITAAGRETLAAAESAMAATLAELLERASEPAKTLDALQDLSQALDRRHAERHGGAGQEIRSPGTHG